MTAVGALGPVVGSEFGSGPTGTNGVAPAAAAESSSSDAPSVQWVREYSSDGSAATGTPGGGGRVGLQSVVRTRDDGYALAGFETPPDGARNVLLLKTDADGRAEWTASFGGSDVDEARSHVQTVDRGFLLVGMNSNPAGEEQTAVGPSNAGWAVKVNAAGKEQWTATPDEESWSLFEDAVQTSDGGYALTGWVEADDLRGWFVKLDPAGRVVVDRRYDSSDDYPRAVEERFWAVTETASGDLVFAGENADGTWVLRTTPGGEPKWETFLEYPYAAALDVVETADGDLLLVGRLYERDEETQFTMTDERNPSDLYLALLDASGTEQWTKAYDGGGNEHGHAVIRTDDGGFAAVGGSNRGNRDTVIFLVETDDDGNERWSETYLEDEWYSNEGEDVVQAADGGYALVVSHRNVLVKIGGESSTATPDDRESDTPTATSETTETPTATSEETESANGAGSDDTPGDESDGDC